VRDVRTDFAAQVLQRVLPRDDGARATWAYRFAKKHWFFGFGAYT
jgi:hypothetical protein